MVIFFSLSKKGTGLNACYVERLESVELWEGDNNDPAQVIVLRN